MPHHAGDVLFFALAFNQIDTPCQRIAVNSAYADIVRTIAPDLDVFTVPTPQVNRGAAFAKGQTVRDYDYFEAYKDNVPHDSFYIYCRPSRNYNTTDFHLIDHFAFALGYSARAQSELLIQKRPNPRRLTDPQRAGVPAKILLHFDAGWPLKIYPRKLQTELIDLLLKQNHRVTVLAAPGYDYPGITSVKYVSLSAFDALARAHDVLVGMDSFPSHYGAHILGLPTICLFASTKPVNSNAPACAYYTDLEKGLDCRPCYAVSQCPVYGGTECQNFVPPQQVFDEIKRLLMGAVPSIHVVHTALAKKNSTPGRILIRLQWVELQVWLTNLLLPVMYGMTLLHEFVLAIKREGGLAALGRSARFISRKAWIIH